MKQPAIPRELDSATLTEASCLPAAADHREGRADWRGCRAYLFILLMAAAPVSANGLHDSDASDDELSEITVSASRIANTRPAGSYPALATALRFDPQVELQSRGLPEGQADVTIRGGLFENTGFTVGAVTIIDPQTGHYAAELPLDPAFLSRPETLTGIDSALRGFNSTIGTIAYSIPEAREAGSVALGAGSDELLYQVLRLSAVQRNDDRTDLAARVSVASSRGDGSLPNGDHEFERYNLHLQRARQDSQTDLILAWQDKFYGWPGAYTGFSTLPETDRTQTTLILGNYRQSLEHGWFEVGTYYRRLEDDYDFDRTTQESGTAGSFDHETVVHAVGFQGLYRHGRVDWRYGGQLTTDELVRSTDLTNGDFDRRRYLKLGVVSSLDVADIAGGVLSLRVGATFDASNRDDEAVSPLLGATFNTISGDTESFVDLQYAVTSQVPGYTALKSPPSGLFGGNPSLGREKARQLALSVGREGATRSGKITLFYRKDDALVDWTYDESALSVRQANALDADVTGFEILFGQRWSSLELAGGYTWIDKDVDYGQATVDASYYALNYARHRATLAAIWHITDRLEWRADSEYRLQRDNPLRTSSANALTISLSVVWERPDGKGLGWALTADNLTDNDYQQFPGTPAVGRQVSANVRYGW